MPDTITTVTTKKLDMLVSGVRSKTNLLLAPAQETVRAPRLYLQRRAEVVWAKLAPERMPDTSTAIGRTYV